MTTRPPPPPALRLRRWKSRRDKRLYLLAGEALIFLADIKPEHPAVCVCERCEARRAAVGVVRGLRAPLRKITPRR